MRIKTTLLALFLLSAATVAHAGVTVANPAIAAVYLSSMDVTWTSTNTATGYELDASTDPAFSVMTTVTVIATPFASSDTVTGLLSNTTYYVRVGGVSAGTTNYAVAVPTSTTLSDLLISPVIAQFSSMSVTANWFAFSAGSGPNTASGYRLLGPLPAENANQ